MRMFTLMTNSIDAACLGHVTENPHHGLHVGGRVTGLLQAAQLKVGESDLGIVTDDAGV